MRIIRKRVLTLLVALALVLSTLAYVPAQSAKAASAINVSYRTHIQAFGWEGEAGKTSTWKKDGEMSGTSGKAKRLEGIEIAISGNSDLGIQYTTHCQSYGWLPWSADGEMNGTEGEVKRLEAIKIKLIGADASKYDVYYRVHAQTYGWLSWAKNGQAAGTAGLAKRLEGIQVVVLPKGQTLPSEYNGIKATNDKAYINKTGASDEDVSGADETNVTIIDYHGETVCRDLHYMYCENDDKWYALNSYMGFAAYNKVFNEWDDESVQRYISYLPDEFILTREQVQAMDVDKNTDKLPETGLLYDGTVEPGTPFSN